MSTLKAVAGYLLAGLRWLLLAVASGLAMAAEIVRPYRGIPRNGLRLVGAMACAALLAGCATTQERVRTVRVEVPVAVDCPRPPLPLADVPPGAGPDAIARAALASLHACTGYAKQLEALHGR